MGIAGRPPQLPRPPAAARWAREGVALAVAPLARDPRAQRFARAAVAVSELSSPAFALEFEAQVALQAPTTQVHARRSVGKRELAAAMELAAAAGGTGEALTDALGEAARRGNAARHAAVRRWLRGAGNVPAPRMEELIEWLLARMVLARSGDQWTLLLAGEDGAEWTDYGAAASATAAADEDPRDARRGYTQGHAPVAGEAEAGPLLLDETDERPPGYEDASYAPASPLLRLCPSGAPVNCSQVDADDEDGREASDPFNAGENGDEDAPPLIDSQDTPRYSPITPDGHEKSTKIPLWERKSGSRSFRSREPSERLASLEPDSEAEKDPRAPRRRSFSSPGTKSVYAIEPATLRLRSNYSATHLIEPNEWTDDRHRFEVELTASKRDLEKARLEKANAQRVAELRTQQILQRSRKMSERAHQRRQDAECVKHLIADTLEYHSILLNFDAQIKQTKIASQREQERLKICARTAAGRTEKWKRGAVLGPGPLSQQELNLRGSLSGKPITSVYDLHGRRHSLSDAGNVAAESDFESAMRKVQRALMDSGNALDVFRRYDVDGSGALSYAEFLKLMKERCNTTLTEEQSKEFFRHFDPNRSGEIDYGELLWGFFNRRAFLKRWQQKRQGRSDREIKTLFYRYDRTGRGALSMADFLLALDDLCMRVTEEDAKLLCMRFDANHDGFVDYNEFCEFINGPTTRPSNAAIDSDELGSAKRQNSRVQPVHSNSNVHSSTDRHQIFAEIDALQQTQMKINRELHSQ